MAENDNGHTEPTSPRRVAADALVSIILLAGSLAAETLKGFIPKGVPFVVTAILIVSEVTLMVYFLVVLARAVGYAFTEVEKVRDSLEGTRSWQVGKRSMRAGLSLLRESSPNASDFGRAFKFGFRFVSVLAIVGSLFLLAVGFVPGQSTAPGEVTARTSPSYLAETPVPTPAAPKGEEGSKVTALDAAGRARREPAGPPSAERAENSVTVILASREELMRQLREIETQLAALQKRQSELRTLLESQASIKLPPNQNLAPYLTRDYLEESYAHREPFKFGNAERAEKVLEHAAVRPRNLDESFRALSEKRAEAWEPSGGLPIPVTPRPSLAVVYALVDNRWRVVGGALVAAFLTLVTSLFLQVKRRPAGGA